MSRKEVFLGFRYGYYQEGLWVINVTNSLKFHIIVHLA
jgi:hypothetical protein